MGATQPSTRAERSTLGFRSFVGQDADTIVNILTLEVMQPGPLKRRALGLVLDWAELHRDELLANWELAREGKPLNQIAPLE